MTGASRDVAMIPNASIEVPAWAWALAAVSLLAVFLILQENGTLLSSGAANWLHEVTHDGRHALGVPCD